MSGLNLQVDNELVLPIIEAEIQSAIVRQLESADNLIPKMVQAALNQGVNSSGVVSKYKHDNEHTYIEYLCNQALQKAARVAMDKFIDENMPLIEAELAKQLARSKNKIAKAFVTGLGKSMKSTWRFDVGINFNPSED